MRDSLLCRKLIRSGDRSIGPSGEHLRFITTVYDDSPEIHRGEVSVLCPFLTWGTPEESGIRIVPEAKIHLPAFVQQRIRTLGYRGVRGFAKQALLSPQVIYNLLNGETVSSFTIQVLAEVLQTPRAEFAALVEQHQSRLKSGHKMDTPPVENSKESS